MSVIKSYKRHSCFFLRGEEGGGVGEQSCFKEIICAFYRGSILYQDTSGVHIRSITLLKSRTIMIYKITELLCALSLYVITEKVLCCINETR